MENKNPPKTPDLGQHNNTQDDPAPFSVTVYPNTVHLETNRSLRSCFYEGAGYGSSRISISGEALLGCDMNMSISMCFENCDGIAQLLAAQGKRLKVDMTISTEDE